MDYTFETINDKEFENLCRDLLNKKFGLSLQSFKKGKDGGIDLRYSTQLKDNSLVVQVKHFVGSGFAQLKHVLLNDEFEKVKKLAPDRYIIATSVPLNPIQKNQLKMALAPFVLTANDIIGAEDLNTYLGEFPEIEKSHFKLWFSSINVLEGVLNNAIGSRTGALLKKIKNKIPFYVITRKLDAANAILMREKVLLITGQPGIGKTTLADTLLFEKAKNDFHIYQVINISEAEDVMSQNEEQKQIFYFDDFLGANYSEIVNSHKTETQLTSFVERVKSTPNKYLILTTRTIILNYAVEHYEKINHSGLNRRQFEIVLDDYSKYEKALILYNHLYFKNIDPAFFDQITQNHFYRQVVAHKNYTPRIIDFITEEDRLIDVSAEQYPAFIINNLNNPKDIWKHSFLKQISHPERCLLLILFTFENGAVEPVLNTAFQKRMRYEKEVNNRVLSATQFDESLQLLLNGFISATLFTTTPPRRRYDFINPSLADFLIGYINESHNERRELISSLTYTDQLKRFRQSKRILMLERELQEIICKLIMDGELTTRSKGDSEFTSNKENIELLETLCLYCPDTNKDEALLMLFSKLDLSESFVPICAKLFYTLHNLGNAPKTILFLQNRFELIIHQLIGSTDDYDDAKTIPELFDLFNQDYETYIESKDGSEHLIDMMNSVLSRYEDDTISDNKGNIFAMEAAEDIYTELAEIENLLKSHIFPYKAFDYDFNFRLDESYWAEIIQENNAKADYKESRIDNDYELYREGQFDARNEERTIDDLFNN